MTRRSAALAERCYPRTFEFVRHLQPQAAGLNHSSHDVAVLRAGNTRQATSADINISNEAKCLLQTFYLSMYGEGYYSAVMAGERGLGGQTW